MKTTIYYSVQNDENGEPNEWNSPNEMDYYEAVKAL